ncbi:MAG: hypothetical protein ACHQRM_02095 [Bacteroidia bacterium]
MTNNANNDFERKVKSSMEGYEASFDPADWSDMENRLQAMPQHSPVFKWKFSLNTVAVIIACSALAFLVIRLTAGSKSRATNEKQIQESVTPVKMTSVPVTAKTVQEQPKPQPEVMAAAKEETLDTAPTETEKISNYLLSAGNASKNNESSSYRRMQADRNVSTVAPIQPQLNGTDAQKVRIYPDMVDPKKGVIFNTREKTGTDAVQTEVNVGWNDFVIYPPSKKDSSVKESPVESKTAAAKSKSERKSIFSRKSKKEKPAEKAEPVTTPVPAEKTTTDNSPADPAPVKTDTLKKTKLKNPKFKENHSPLDPY